MKCIRPPILWAACLTVAFGSLAVALSAPPASNETEAEVAREKPEKSAAKRGQKDPETTAHQATPVLGVMIGKPMGVDGAEVIRVWPGSPAEKAGLKKGDLVTGLDEKEVRSPEKLRAGVVKHSPGETIELKVDRNGQEKRIQVTLSGGDEFQSSEKSDTHRTWGPHAWLGVRMLPDSGDGRGVTIEDVVPASPADLAGLKPDDKILRIDKTRVEAVADLQMQVVGHSPGDSVRLVVERGGTNQKIDVELGAFAGWQGDVSELNEAQVRQLLEEFMRDAFSSPNGSDSESPGTEKGRTEDGQRQKNEASSPRKN